MSSASALGGKSVASDGAPRSLHNFSARATSHRAGRKLLVTPDGLAHGLTLVGICQTSFNALPERLRERNSFWKGKRHRLGRELLCGHGKNVAIRVIPVNTVRQAYA